MTVRFLEAARDDQRLGLGADFRKEVRAAVERIQALPEAWHPLSENTRRCLTKRFPYGVIDQARADEILIVAVAHLHREPEHWKGRTRP